MRRLLAEAIVLQRSAEAALAEYQALAAQDSISPYGLRLLAALELDRGQPAAASAALRRAIETRVKARSPEDAARRWIREDDVDRLLHASVLLELGDFAPALAALDALLARSPAFEEDEDEEDEEGDEEGDDYDDAFEDDDDDAFEEDDDEEEVDDDDEEEVDDDDDDDDDDDEVDADDHRTHDTVYIDASWYAGIEQARGDALNALARHDEARAAYERAVRLLSSAGDNDIEIAHLQLDLARLARERGEHDTALAAAAAGLTDAAYDPTEGAIRLLRAALLAERGRLDEGLEELTVALTQAPDADLLRAQIDADDALALLRAAPGYATAVTEPRAAARWLDALPPLAALREHEGLASRGVRFLDEDDARSGGEALREHYAGSLHLGTLWIDALWDECKRITAPLWRLATGPRVAGPRHVGGTKVDVELYVDPGDPAWVWILPHIEFPAALMTRVPADGDAIARALDVLFLNPPRSIDALPCTTRAFMGYMERLVVPSPYSGELEQAGPHELDRHYNFSPALDPLVWGGAYDDDPWPDEMPRINQIRMITLSRERRGQRRGGVARLSRRAQFSRAHVGVELHQPRGQTHYVWHIRHAENPYPETIARLNDACGTRFPTSLPADVVAGIIGFDWMSAADAEAATADVEPGLVPAYLRVIAAIRSQDLEVTDLLRAHASRPDLAPAQRAAIADLCVDYGWRALLEELAVAEPDPGLRGSILRALADPMPETEFTEMGEPTQLYSGEDDEDEDEEDDDDE